MLNRVSGSDRDHSEAENFRSGWVSVLLKIIFFAILITLLIAIDGELTYDILDFKMDTVFEWFLFCVILAMIIGIYFVGQGKKDDHG
tara:strand:+ start:76 stop:336 length:261 start_codon:yes stop_codon:yes gene_type:complete